VNTPTTALVIAIVGVLGTLLAPIVSQTLSARARREEFEQQRTTQLEKYARQQNEELMAAKRSCYLGLFTAFRHYRVELMSYLHAVNRKDVDESARARLQEARHAVMASVSETQLSGSLVVMETLRPLREANTKIYEAIKSLEEGQPEGLSFEEIREFMLTVWGEEWPHIVDTVRADLGVSD
jgi:type II secretory pathway pseudopilin PulG